VEIHENLSNVRQRVYEAAQSAGRNPSDIKLLAVSKTMSADIVKQAYDAGQREFAENRVQEWLEKVTVLPMSCQWHLVGRLQTNKVKFLDSRISLIHSLDRLKLLEELEHQGARQDVVWPTLVQINTAQDPNKAGFLENEVEDFLETVARCEHVRVHGLMTIGALDATPKETREFFRQLRLIKENLHKKIIPNVDLKELSMGMSQDFEIAIHEGATIIRVGRQIFGER
jgi:PLP dependent protein